MWQSKMLRAYIWIICWIGHCTSTPSNWRHDLDDCTSNQVGAFDKGIDKEAPNFWSNSESFTQPKLPDLNSTTWEQWEFDLTSADGRSGIVLGLSRDPNYRFLGRGILRVELFITDGESRGVRDVDFVDASTVWTCANGATYGIWSSINKEYSFYVAPGESRAEITFDTPKVIGGFNITSRTQAQFVKNVTSQNPKNPARLEAESLELSPSLYMIGSIPGGIGHANFSTIDKRGSLLNKSFEGTAGHVHMWATRGWLDLVDSFRFIRGSAGDSYFWLWIPVSRVDEGGEYGSAVLFVDGELVVATTRTSFSLDSNHLSLRPKYMTSGIRGSFADRAAGYDIHFVAPQSRRVWYFSVVHAVKSFETNLGGFAGITGFTATVSGGEVGGVESTGSAFVEQFVLPEVIARWQFWLMTVMGRLDRIYQLLTATKSYSRSYQVLQQILGR